MLSAFRVLGAVSSAVSVLAWVQVLEQGAVRAGFRALQFGHVGTLRQQPRQVTATAQGVVCT